MEADLRKIYNPFENPTEAIIKEKSEVIKSQIKDTMKSVGPQIKTTLKDLAKLENQEVKALAEFMSKQKNSPERKALEE